MDIFQALKHDHNEIKTMLEQLEKSTIRKQDKIFDKLKKELISHIKLEERLFYKEIMTTDVTLRHEVFEGIEEHNIVRKLLREISLTSDEEKWVAKAMVMRHLIEDHIKKEEKLIFSKAKLVLDRPTEKKLGEKYGQQHEKMAA